MLKYPEPDEYTRKWKKFVKENNLTWDEKKKKWSRAAYPDFDKNGNFTKFKLGYHKLPTCKFCGLLLKGKQTRFCSDQNCKVRYFTIVKNAKKKFGLKDIDLANYDPKIHKDWGVIFNKKLWETRMSKDGSLFQVRIRDRIENKDVTIMFDHETFPFTEKTGTTRRKKR